MENTMLRKMKDDWEEFFFGNDNGEKELFESVTDMEANSQWIPGISSRDIIWMTKILLTKPQISEQIS